MNKIKPTAGNVSSTLTPALLPGPCLAASGMWTHVQVHIRHLMFHLLWASWENMCHFGDRRDGKAQGWKAESYWWIWINFPFWLRVEEDPGGPYLGSISCWEHWDFACKTVFELQLEMPLPSAKSKGTSIFQRKGPVAPRTIDLRHKPGLS